MTALSDSTAYQEAKQLGALAVMEKPIDLNDLRSLVDEFASG